MDDKQKENEVTLLGPNYDKEKCEHCNGTGHKQTAYGEFLCTYCYGSGYVDHDYAKDEV